MTLVTGTVQDLGYDGMEGTLWARPARFRSDGQVVYAPERKPYTITGGVVSAELAPGPAVLEVQVGSHARGTFEVVIPEEDTTLADLLDTVFVWEPEQVSLFVAEREAAEQAASEAEAAAGQATTAAQQTGQDRSHVDQVRTELDEAFDESTAGNVLPPRLTEAALNATYGPWLDGVDRQMLIDEAFYGGLSWWPVRSGDASLVFDEGPLGGRWSQVLRLTAGASVASTIIPVVAGETIRATAQAWLDNASATLIVVAIDRDGAEAGFASTPLTGLQDTSVEYTAVEGEVGMRVRVAGVSGNSLVGLIRAAKVPPADPGVPTQRHAALIERHARPIVGVMLGSSSVQGAGSSTLLQRMSNRLEKMLQASYNPAGIRGGYSLRMGDAGAGISGGTVTEGGWYPDAGLTGLGHRRRSLTSGQTVTWTGTGTGFTFGFKSGTGMGGLELAVDGGTPYLVTPNQTGAEAWDAQHTTSVLAHGSHTITIKAVGGPQHLDFGYVHDGDHHAGVRLYNNGWGAHPIGSHVVEAKVITERFAQLKPDFIVIYSGGNEAIGAISYATLVGQMRDLVAMIYTACGGTDSDMPWLAFMPQARHYAVAEGYDYERNLVRAMQTVAAENPRFASFHEGTWNPYPVDQTADNAWLDMVVGDDVHPSTIGHQLIADIIADELDLPSRVVAYRDPPAVGGSPVTVGGGLGADPSIIAELDADTLTGASGATVTSWADTAGRTTFSASGTGADNTLVTDFGGRKAVRILGKLLDGTVPAHVGPLTATIVFRATSLGGPLFGRQQSSDAFSWITMPDTNGNIQTGSGTPAVAVAPAGTIATGTRYIVTATHDGTTARLYINGVQVATGTYTANANSGVGPGMRLGGTTGATTSPTRADIAYMLVRKGASSSADVSALAGTLATKYGITL